MKTFARVLSILFYAIEGICAFAILVGMTFRSMKLAGATELLMVGLFSITCLYFLIAITPFYMKYVSTDTVFNEKLILFFRRLLYVVLSMFSITILFISNNLMGKEQIVGVVLPIVIVFTILAVVLIIVKRARQLILGGALIRIGICYALYFIFTLSAAN